MSDNPSLPKARGPTIIAARAVEEGMETLDFRSNSGQGPAPVPQPSNSERRPEAKPASRVDEQISVGRVMKALFPDGIQIADEEQFATMRCSTRWSPALPSSRSQTCPIRLPCAT